MLSMKSIVFFMKGKLISTKSCNAQAITIVKYCIKKTHRIRKSTIQPFALLRNTQSCDATFCDAVVTGFITKEQSQIGMIASR